MKKHFLLLIALFATLLMVQSCGQKSENSGSPKERLNGSWKIVEATGQFAEMNKGTTYIFDGQTKFTSKLGIIESKGDITAMSDSTFDVRFEGMQADFNYTYRFDGDKLIISLSSSDQVFTLEKQ